MKRRNFVRSMASSGALLFLPRAHGEADKNLLIGSIGVGGKGRSDLDQLARHGQLVAACDVNGRKLDYALQSYPRVARYSDYRKMISQWAGKIDAVTISSPDHTHAHATQLALNAGMHVFVQAPMAHTVWEARQLRLLARDKKACVQVGMQGCAHNGFRQGVEYLQSGEIGDILEVHVWTNRPTWPQGPKIHSRPAGEFPIPNELDWNAFLGPAFKRPYHPSYQPFNWRGWRDFGTGALGDSGIHLLNLPAMGCGLDVPQKVKCMLQAPNHPETYPAWGTVRFDFSAPSSSKIISLYWHEGRVGHLGGNLLGEPNLPNEELFLGKKPSPQGCIILGSKGSMFSASAFGATWEAHLGDGWKLPTELALPVNSLGRNGRGDSGMKEELVQAIRKNQPSFALANFEYAGKLTEWMLLGNVVMSTGGEFKWNEKELSCGRTDANSLLNKPYRDGWTMQPV